MSEGQGELTVTFGLGPAASLTLAREEIGGDLRWTDSALGAGAGFAAEFSLDVADRSSAFAGFSQTASLVFPAGNTNFGYTYSVSGFTDGSFNFSGTLGGGLSTQGVSPYVDLEVGGSINLKTGRSQVLINPGAGVRNIVSGGAGGFALIDWDFWGGPVKGIDPVAGKNPQNKPK
jgi:hypothetical protein